MRKMCLISFFTLLALAPISIAVSSGAATAAEEIFVQKIEPFSYFCLPHKGPFSQLPELMGRLMQEANLQNAVPSGPLMGIYYSNPDLVENDQLEWELGFPVTPQTLVQPPLEKKEWNYALVVTCVYKGPYEKASDTIAKMLDWMAANGYESAGPILERYMDMNPQELDPKDLTTEIWIPCQKKSAE